MGRKNDGLYLRGTVWYLDCRLNGQRHVVKLGKGIKRSVAAELAQVKRGAILRAEAGIRAKRKDCGFDEIQKEFIRWAETNLRPSTVKQYKKELKQLAESFAGRKLSAISALDVERHKHRRVAAGTTVNANRELTRLRQLYTMATRWGRYEGPNPTATVKKLTESRGRVRFLTDRELARLLYHAREPARSAIVLCISTGIRLKSEALTLTWDQVDVERRTLTVLDSYAKNKSTRTVPLNSAALDALQRLRQISRGPAVIAKPNGQPYKGLDKPLAEIVAAAGLRDVSAHVLRHTFASSLAMNGVGLRTVQELGGWKTLNLVQRYSHLTPDHKQDAVERIAEQFHNAFHNSDSEAGSEPSLNKTHKLLISQTK